MASDQQPQRSLGYRAGAGLRAGGDKAYGWFRRWLAKVWKVRGGGLYATGFICTLIYLEISTLLTELSEATGIGQFFTEQLVEFLLRFSAESLGNLIQAFIWPVHIIGLAPPWGAIGLGLGFAVFQLYLNKPVERWLLGDES